MRSILALAASALAAVAAIVADLDGGVAPFFVGLTFFAGVEAWATQSPYTGPRRIVARAIAVVWLVAAVWIGVLLVMYQTACGCSSPSPPPTNFYIGLPGVIYELVGLYGGLILILASAFGNDQWWSARQPRAATNLPDGSDSP
jgi:hypothetical protein